ncbi:threonine-phosphate decarboxylase [Peptoniphilus sp. ING2-D1G]|nr:threonine-phosphate decarboxylase [Peptoniphilus sp. ING2-D1G]
MKNKHGANIFEISREYGFDLKDISDFSSNINPMGASKRAKRYLIENIDLVSTYPDTDYVGLKESIRDYSGAKTENILLFSGTTEGIVDYIKIINPKRAMLLSPCYSEYERELRKINSEIFYYNLMEDKEFKIDLEDLIYRLQKYGIDMLVFTNPNNPTGTILKRDEIEEILKNTDTKILLDETYVEFTDTGVFSSIPLTDKYENLLVMRGVSKFFAMPGIRLGYGVSSSKFVKDAVNKEEILWNINIFADIMGRESFLDKQYQEGVYEYISSQRQFMERELKKVDDIKVFKSYGNFILSKILKGKSAAELREHLLKGGMVIRDCSNFKNLNESYFRFCILEKDENKRLLEGIKEFFQK